MRFLLNANLSPRLSGRLTDTGYDVVQVADVGLLTALDSVIFDYAADEGYVVIAQSDPPVRSATSDCRQRLTALHS